MHVFFSFYFLKVLISYFNFSIFFYTIGKHINLLRIYRTSDPITG
ncbi:hypothetical protein J2X83_003746 [Brevibacillus nitrificans]|nr:hypothetical protein [Brevibacillus nitrificans]